MSTQPQPVKGLELKPCPFCGNTPVLTRRDVEPQNDSWYGKTMETFVLCDCGACLFDGRFHEGFGEHVQGNERAIEHWNTRAISSAISEREGLVRRLVEALKEASFLVEMCAGIGTPFGLPGEAQKGSPKDLIDSVLAEARKAGVE